MRARRRRPSLDAPEPVDAILARAGEDRFARSRAPISMPMWRTIVGPRVAERTQPLKLEGGVLVVRVATSGWAHELSLLSEPLLANLARHGVKADKLVFRTGAIDAPTRPPERRQSTKVPPPAELPPDIAESLSHVTDDELRVAMSEAIAQSLATAAWAYVEEGLSGSQRGARAPRSVAPRSAPPDPDPPPDRARTSRSRGGAGDRSR